MTSLSSASIQKPSARTLSSGVPGPHGRVKSQTLQHPPRSVPHQILIDLTGAASSSRDSAEPLIKRQKVNGGQAYTTTCLGTRAPEDVDRNAGQVWRSALTKDAAAEPNGGAINIPATSGFTAGHDTNNAIPPFPARPLKHVRANRNQSNGPRAPGKPTSRGDVLVKPYQLEVPAIAPHYQGAAPADFFPWTGNHPEDTLNEHTTKTGYYDKIQISQNEMNTARPSVWSSLKHKSGLQILSSLFASALDQRQTHGTITMNCTFKPPPRVTLTDTKREAWLRDLANPAIPLRRLSRTIPHGIRGKALLDHCVAKNIPTSRAIWLAKCVGANEIRASKRKGTSGAFGLGGEAKWIKDWTSNVEQFIEAVIESCGSPEWKDNMTYGLRLAAHLYSEQLLDQAHYLTWMTTSFHECNLDKLPIWLLVLQIHWHELQSSRRFGRYLAESMLEQLSKVRQHDGNFQVSLRQKLAEMVRSFAMSAPNCFILPNCWIKYESVLGSCSRDEDRRFKLCFARLLARNLRLARPVNPNVLGVSCTVRQKLINALDNVPAYIDISELSNMCLIITDIQDVLVPTLLEWASTWYRVGVDRLYITVRLLRRWSNRGIDLDPPILAFLASSQSISGLHNASLHKLLAELIRSRHFSVGKYLQWLMARGALTSRNATNHGDRYDLRLLYEVPLFGLPAHVLNLRQILVKSMGSSVAEEQQMMVAAKNEVSKRTLDFITSQKQSMPGVLQVDLKTLNGTVKADLGRWIRLHVADCCQSHITTKSRDQPAMNCGPGSVSINPDQFQALRCVLEDLEEFPILADVLKILADREDALILRAVADTINYHFKVFMAIGAANDLFQTLISRLEHLHSIKAPGMQLIISLIDLGCRLPSAAGHVRTLRKELLLHEPKCAVAACSPVSDHMADALQSADLTFADELEQLLSSGTSMDKQTLSRLFGTILQRLEKSWTSPPPVQSVVSLFGLLPRLRSFNADIFDTLMDSWVQYLLPSTSRPSLSTILIPLICTRSVTLRTVLDQTNSYIEAHGNNASSARLALESLYLLTIETPDDHVASLDRSYRYYIERDQIITASPSLVVSLICSLIHTCVHGDTATQENARALIASMGCRSLMQRILLGHHSAIDELGHAFGIWSIANPVDDTLDRLLDPTCLHSLPRTDIGGGISKVLQIANDFNISICRVKLRALISASQEYNKDMLEDSEAIIATLIQSPSTLHIGTCMRLISKLPLHSTLKLHDKASELLLSGMPGNSMPSPRIAEDVAEGLIATINATMPSLTDDGTSSVIAKLANKLAILQLSPVLTVLPTTDHDDCDMLAGDKRESRQNDLFFGVDVILRLLAIHQTILKHPNFSQNLLPRLLLSLSFLLIHPILSSHPALSTYIFDTTALLSDCLSDEARSHCIRSLRDQHKIRDPRLRFILGYSENAEGEWLHLVTVASSPLNPNPKALCPTGKTTSLPFPLRRWEMMQDATPMVGENDTSLSLSLFGARKAV